MKRFILFFGSIVLLSSLQTAAQTTPNATQTATPENQSAQTVNPQDADVVITANVTVKELKFETVPNPTVVFFGNPERNSIWEADRKNLPKPVEPGVTYRNVGIQLRIASRFADIDRIVSEALGETPVTNESVNPLNLPAATITTALAQTKTSTTIAGRKPVAVKRRNK